jgi:hypothetical protein
MKRGFMAARLEWGGIASRIWAAIFWSLAEPVAKPSAAARQSEGSSQFRKPVSIEAGVSSSDTPARMWGPGAAPEVQRST